MGVYPTSFPCSGHSCRQCAQQAAAGRLVGQQGSPTPRAEWCSSDSAGGPSSHQAVVRAPAPGPRPEGPESFGGDASLGAAKLETENEQSALGHEVEPDDPDPIQVHPDMLLQGWGQLRLSPDVLSGWQSCPQYRSLPRSTHSRYVFTGFH